MHEFITFIQDMFLCKDNNDRKVGLTQFKTEEPIEKPKKIQVKSTGNVKLSDLMRRSC